MGVLMNDIELVGRPSESEDNPKVTFENAQEFLDNGYKPDHVFDWVECFVDGFAMVELDGKCNYINEDCKIISDQWFDYASDFRGGFARVRLDDKWNFINTNGEYLSEQWFDFAYEYFYGFCEVEIDGERYKIDREGNII